VVKVLGVEDEREGHLAQQPTKIDEWIHDEFA
jgi:hypothetical protein